MNVAPHHLPAPVLQALLAQWKAWKEEIAERHAKEKRHEYVICDIRIEKNTAVLAFYAQQWHSASYEPPPFFAPVPNLTDFEHRSYFHLLRFLFGRAIVRKKSATKHRYLICLNLLFLFFFYSLASGEG